MISFFGRGLGQGAGSTIRVKVGLAALLIWMGGATASHALVTPPTIANNTFASTPVGQSLTQTVTLTLTSASAIKSIALATGTAASSEYVLESVSGCTVDGTTSNASGTVCKLSVKYTPLFPGSLAAPNLSRNAQLLYTDGGSNVTAYGLSGAATRAIGHVVPGTVSLYAGQPYTGASVSPLDNGLGGVTGGYAGNGVAATSAQFDFAPFNAIYSSPEAGNATQPMAFDSQGNLYVIDGPNFIIRKIDNTSTHVVTTIAGTAQSQGYSGDGGAATSAKLNNPRAITLDAAGNIYFLDTVATNNAYYVVSYSVIRRIDALTGIITAVAGQLFTGQYDTADGGGTCNLSNNSLYAIYQCGDGGLATYAYLNHPYNLALDAAGNFYLWASGSGSESVPIIREISASKGDISTVATNTDLNATNTFGGMTIGSDGNLYVLAVDLTNGGVNIKQFNPKTKVVTNLAGMTSTQYQGCIALATQQEGFPATNLELSTGASGTSGDLSADASGNIYVTDGACAQQASTGPQTIARVNIESATAYYEARGNGYSYGAGETAGYNSFFYYVIEPITAIPDNAGNIFFESWNQIAELSGQNAELNYTEMYDFQTSAAQTAAYTNLGNDSATAPTYTFQVGKNFVLLETGDTKTCDVVTSVPIGGSCNLDIAFSPVQVGDLTDELNVSGSGGTETVTVTGIGDAAAQLSVSPTAVNFGNQALNTTSAPKTFTLTNTGTANLTIENSEIDGASLTDYAVVANGGTCNTSSSTSLAPNASCTFEVTFTPTSLGPLPANFYVFTSINFGDVATVTGTGVPAPAVVTETGNLWFNPAPVGIAAASAQTLTATFTITGATSVITPTAVMHYGLAYKVGKVTCTGAAGNQTCTVPVTFIPNYPGGRKDALFLMNGTTRLATQLAYGVGESPFAMIQPGVVTNALPGNNAYVYDSVVDENGTVWAYLNSTIYSVTAAGVVTPLSVPGPSGNSDLSIDGAGIIYFGAPPPGGNFVTYDTVQGIVGSVAPPVGATYYDGIAAGNEGNLYEVDNDTSTLYTVKPDGTNTAFSLNSSYGNPYSIVVDTNENLFATNGGNGSTEEITPADVETQVNTTGGNLGIDAANTVYVERFYGLGTSGVGELPASGYANALAVIDSGTSPTGNGSVAPDGTVYVGNYDNLDKVDRSQGAISFGEQESGTAATPQTIQVYNGGNETLTLSNISISGEAFTIGTSASNNCSTTTGIAVGALCNLTVDYLPTHAGVYSGTVTITSNSLNNTTTTQTVALSGFVYGVYVTAAPNPLAFGSIVDGNTSAPMTVTFTNNGDLYSAGIGGFSSTDPAFVITPSAAGCSSVGVGSSCTATVTFAPTAVQAYSATISYSASSSGGGANQNGSFTVTGTGTAAPAPVASLSPTTLSFPSTAIGSTATALSTTLSNTGNATLNITGITLSDTTDFAETTTCGSTLAAGKTCSISVTFTPAAAQAYTATLSVADNASGSPQTAALSGTGTPAPAPVASLSPTTLTLANTAVGSTSAAMSTTLSNTGNATLNITGITLSDTTDFAETTTCGSTLAAGKTCAISVTFTPAAAQAYTATLSVADNASGSPQTAAVSGTGTPAPAPVASLSPTTLTLANTAVGSTSAAMSTTLSNTGNATLNITGITLSDTTDFAETTTCGSTLAAGKTCSISVTFTPAAAQTYNATLSVADNASGSPQTAALSGTGTPAPAPVASLSPTTLTLASTAVGSTSAAVSTTLSNTGNATLNISGITLSDTADFAETTTCGSTLAAGKTCTISVTFTPAAAQAYTATLSVADNASGSPQTAALSGTGTPAPVPVASLSPTTLSFANTAVGSTSAAISTTLSNTGNATLNISGITLSDTTDFAETTTCGSTLAAGKTCSISVTFTPAAAQAYTGTLSVSDNASGSPQTAALSGTGTPAPAPVASLSPTTLSFANTAVGSTSAAISTTLSNTGNATLNISGITLSDTTDFAETTTCGSTLAAGKTCTISVTFTPGAAQAYTATLSVADNASGSPQTAALSGTGTPAPAPVASLSPTTLSFANTAVGSTSAAISTTLSNTGNATLNISGITLSDTTDFAETTTCGSTLAAGKTCSISVTFTPAAAQAYTATLSVADNASGSPQTAALSGTGTPAPVPVASLSPTTLTLASTAVGSTSAAVSTTLSNTGNATLNISGITLSDTTDFAETTTCGSTLAAGKTCTISVTFTPGAAQAYSATLSVADNASGSPQTAALSGTGTPAPAPVASLSPTTLTLANTAVGSTSAAMSTTLSNTGNATLNITGITLSDTADFAETTTCGSTLAAGKTCTISVTFTPGAAQAYSATLSVADNASGSPQTAALSGTGTPAPTPGASLSPTTLTFPSTTVGSTSAALSTTLSNTGNATLTITGITLSDTTDFAETTTCGSTLAAGMSCTFSVTFKPGSATSLSGTLSVADNAAGSPQTVALSGTGLPPAATDFTLTVTPAAQTVQAGSIATFTIDAKGIGGDFADAINLTVTGLPPGATGTFSPASITPGANGASSTLSIQTLTQTALAQPRPLHGSRSPWLATLLVVPLFGLRRRLKKQRLLGSIMLLLALLTPTILLTGCGGGYFAITSQSYTVTVTGTSGSTQHSTTVTLTVQQ